MRRLGRDKLSSLHMGGVTRLIRVYTTSIFGFTMSLEQDLVDTQTSAIWTMHSLHCLFGTVLGEAFAQGFFSESEESVSLPSLIESSREKEVAVSLTSSLMTSWLCMLRL